MGYIICIASQKGGVGKTTTAINLSAALAVAEKETLLVDCDPQGHATSGMGIDKTQLKGTLYHAMIGKVMVNEIIMDGNFKCLKILPTGIELMNTDVELISKPYKEKILRNLLGDLKKNYDYIIIDTPPSLSLLTINAIIAADLLLIPLQCEYYALGALSPLLQTVQVLKKRFYHDIKIAGVLLTMYEPREELSLKIAESARNHFKDVVFKTAIPRNIELRESASHGKPLLVQNIMSIGAQGYLELAREFMSRWPTEMGKNINEKAVEQ